MARRLKAALASFLAAALVLLSPGLEAPRLFAQVIGRAAPVEGIRAVPGMTGGAVSAAPTIAPAMTASALAAPALNAAPAAAPMAAAPALTPAAAPAASVPAMAKALAPHIEAAAQAQTSASGAASAGRSIEDVITGGKSAGSGEMSEVAGSASAGAPSLGFSAAASAPSEAPKSGVPAAAAPAEGKTVASETSYRVHRFLLKAVAALTGAVNSLPAAGPVLTQKLIKQAADKTVVLSDYDDTLAGYNQVLPEDMVQAIAAVKAAGKDFVVISDRGDEKRAHQLTVFESLASLPVETRAGMYLAANSGGRVYRYDEKGEPVRVFEAPALDEASKAKVAEAAEATKARLKEIGAEQHFPSEGNNNPSESWGTYGYALMLKVGSGNEAVKGSAAILQDELGKRGMDVEVNPRFAKDPANPPYINFSIVTKAGSAAYIAKALKAEPKDVLVIGDSMYAPKDAKKASWLARWGETLSGREMPKTGNRTDANMEKGVPGALTLSVGTTGDPRASNLWVLAGKGPSVTREVLMSVASKTRAQSRPKAGVSEGAVAAAVAAAIVAAAAAGYYAMFHAFADIVQMGERSIMQHGRDLMDGGMMLGGVLGLAGTLGLGGGRAALASPGETYGEARKKAVELAVSRGGLPASVRFVDAAASMPVRSGAQWKYTFEIPGKTEGTALAYVDFAGFLGGAPEARVSVYEGARAAEGKLTSALEGYLVSMGSKVSPEAALALARKAQPGMSAGVGVSFDYREESVSGDKDLWYRFYDDKGAAVSVNARTGEARVDAALPPKRDGGGSAWKRALGGLGLAALTAAVYGGLYYAASHAPAAVSSVPTAPGGWEMLFGGTLGGLGLGLRARLAEAFRKAKPALITAGLIAATAGMYAAMAYAFMHAPAASSGIQVPEGWQGPIPSNIDIGAIFGGTVGLVGLSGVIKRVKGKAPKITDERVRAAANSAIASKGRPWSQTEYNMSYYMALESLKKDGATPAQIALFEKLCADAPIRGGSFNPWSGD